MILLLWFFLKKFDWNTSVYKKISWFRFQCFSISFIQWIDHFFRLSLSRWRELNWDSQQDRARKTSILVIAFWNFKLKVLKYPQNCRHHNIFVLNSQRQATLMLFIQVWPFIDSTKNFRRGISLYQVTEIFKYWSICCIYKYIV